MTLIRVNSTQPRRLTLPPPIARWLQATQPGGPGRNGPRPAGWAAVTMTGAGRLPSQA